MARTRPLAETDFGRLRLGLPFGSILVMLVLVALIWVTVTAELWKQYRNDEVGAEQDTGNLARGFAENVDHMIESVDQIMLLLRAAYAAHPDPAEVVGWASAPEFSKSLTLQITFVDAAGW